MKDKVLQDVLNVFVNLDDQESPDYYIATGQEASSKMKHFATRGAVDLTTFESDSFHNRLEKP